jgi:tetratricopeptide (TPR) repeat protein
MKIYPSLNTQPSAWSRPMNRVIAFALVFTAVPVFAQQADSSIKATVQAVTESFYARNASAWQSCWIQDAEVSRTIVNGSRFYTAVGWEKFGPATLEMIAKYPKAIPVKFTYDNFTTRVSDGMAWVEYDQKMTMVDKPEFKRLSRESRVLMKKDGKWKIASMITADPETFSPNENTIEGRLNADGYYLLTSGKVEEAIQIFTVNVRLKPGSWNTHDSLAEAYAVAGKKDLAIEHYEQALKLNPKSQSAKEALAKLKGN